MRLHAADRRTSFLVRTHRAIASGPSRSSTRFAVSPSYTLSRNASAGIAGGSSGAAAGAKPRYREYSPRTVCSARYLLIRLASRLLSRGARAAAPPAAAVAC